MMQLKLQNLAGGEATLTGTPSDDLHHIHYPLDRHNKLFLCSRYKEVPCAPHAIHKGYISLQKQVICACLFATEHLTYLSPLLELG